MDEKSNAAIVHDFLGDVLMDLKRCLEILDLDNATSQKQVKEAYRNLVRIWHPDRFPLNSPLKYEAEEKLRNINVAYEKLIAFLSSEYETNKLARLNRKPEVNLKTVERHKTARQQTQSPYGKTAANEAPGKSRQRPYMKPAPAGPSRTSSAGKYLVFFSLLMLTGVTVFIIHYLLTLDQSGSDASAPTSSVLRRLTGDSQPSSLSQDSHSRNRKWTDTGYSGKSKSDSHLSNMPINYCEIYLKDGGIIIAESWWEQGDMIMYKTEYGTIGIEKDTVEKIINR